MIKNFIEVYKFHYINETLFFPKDWKITENFYWNEAFKNEDINDLQPIIIFENIFKSATLLQLYRNNSKPINVHCWLRTIKHNKKVYKELNNPSGGVISLHTLGLAIDFDEYSVPIEQTRKNLIILANDIYKKSKQVIRIEDKTKTWIHVDLGHKYIPNGMRPGLFAV